MNKALVVQMIKDLSPQLRMLGIVRCALFGSFVRDQATEQSDLDLLVDFAPGKKTFINFMQAADLLENKFHRSVDLVTRESLSPFIGPHIIKEAEDVPLNT